MAGVKGRSGRRPLGAKSDRGRAAMRAIVDDPVRWARYVAAIDLQLAEGNISGFQTAFTHGYGNPPQALDVNLATADGPLEFVATLSDGSPATAPTLPVPADPDSGPSS